MTGCIFRAAWKLARLLSLRARSIAAAVAGIPAIPTTHMTGKRRQRSMMDPLKRLLLTCRVISYNMWTATASRF